jgi:aspartokinase/homoserine dehydrogenase 1
MKFLKLSFCLALTAVTSTAFVVPFGGRHAALSRPISTTSTTRVGASTLNAPSDLATTTDDDDATATSTSSQSITRPKGSKNDWEVHKFGGASLATAELYRTVGDLLIKEAAGRGDGGTIPTMAIVSARGGMTDLLVKVVDSALVDFAQAQIALEEAVESQIALLQELAPPEITKPIEERFRNDGADILSVVQSLRMLNTVPAVTMEVVSGFGEIWSAQTLHAYLQTTGVPCDWIDARDILIVKSDSSGLGEKGAASTGGVTPLYEETSKRMADWWNTNGKAAGFHELDYDKESPIVVVTGFVAKTAMGVPTTLKRSGSDYSATIFAKLTDAGRVTMWKNTNGVYTADPRRVPEAFPIASLKYDEAMELAYFGAQVLHPSAMEPCIANEIPVYVRNIFNPAFEGTVIQGRSQTLQEAVSGTDSKVKNWRSKSGEIPIKGITSVDKIALVTLEGASIGGANVAERFMGAMADNDINVLIITQASSESSITIAVPENEGKMALAALEDAFELELSRSTINSVSIVPEMAIVAIVGEGMALTSGVSATFMSSLAGANVNIRLIAQGSSERQVAVVVNGSETTRALRAAHMAFTLSETAASVAILGSTGDIGSALVNQLQTTEEMLKNDLGVKMCVTLAACSTKMAVCESSVGLDMDQLTDLMQSDEAPAFDLDHVTSVMAADVNPLRVVIDCTNSEEVSE